MLRKKAKLAQTSIYIFLYIIYINIIAYKEKKGKPFLKLIKFSPKSRLKKF